MKGLVYTLKNDCYVVSHLAIVTPKDIDSHYLNYFLQVHKPNSLIKDFAYPSISLKDIENMIVLYPPIQDQQRIVAELDCLNEMIAVKQEQLKEFDKLAQSIFYDMFGDPVSNEKGWRKRYYKDFGEVIGGYAFKSDLFVDSGIPVLKIGNINSGELKLEGICYYPYISSLEKYEVHAGDLVISLTGTTGKDDYGNICVIPNNSGTFYLNQRNAILKPNTDCNKVFLQYVFKQNMIKEELTKNCRGVRQANILNKDILNLQIPIPPLELQQQFADKISAIEAQKELVKQSIAETQHLLDYTMEKYFGYD
jgi:type I restriction enzyme S subunit